MNIRCTTFLFPSQIRRSMSRLVYAEVYRIKRKSGEQSHFNSVRQFTPVMHFASSPGRAAPDIYIYIRFMYHIEKRLRFILYMSRGAACHEQYPFRVKHSCENECPPPERELSNSRIDSTIYVFCLPYFTCTLTSNLFASPRRLHTSICPSSLIHFIKTSDAARLILYPHY